MLNPDGVIVGNYRTNLAARDLNRTYKDPKKVSHLPLCSCNMLNLTCIFVLPSPMICWGSKHKYHHWNVFVFVYHHGGKFENLKDFYSDWIREDGKTCYWNCWKVRKYSKPTFKMTRWKESSNGYSYALIYHVDCMLPCVFSFNGNLKIYVQFQVQASISNQSFGVLCCPKTRYRVIIV